MSVRRVILSLLVLIVSTILLLQSDVASFFLRDYIKNAVNSKLQQEVDIVHVRFRPLRLAVEFRGVSVTQGGDVLLLAPKMDVGLAFPFDDHWIRNIVIERPMVNVDIDKLILPEQPEHAEPLKTFPFERLYIVQMDVTVQKGNIVFEGVDYNFTYSQGASDLWTEARSTLSLSDRKITIEPYHWAEITLRPTMFSVQDLALNTSLLDLNGTLKLQEKEISGGVYVDVSLKDLVDTEKVKLDGIARVNIFPRGTIAEPNISFRVESKQVDIWRQGNSREFQHSVKNLFTDVALLDRRLQMKSGSLSWAGGDLAFFGWVDLDTKDVSIQGESDILYLRSLGQDLDLSSAPWLDMPFSTAIHLTGNLDPFALTGDMSIRGRDFAVAGGDIRQKEPLLALSRMNLQGNLSIDRTMLVADVYEAELRDSQGEFRVEYQFKPPNNMVVDYNFPQMNFSELHPLGGSELMGFGSAKGTIRGPIKKLGVRSTISARDFSVIGLSIADEVTMDVSGETLKDIRLTILDSLKGESQIDGVMDIHFGSELVFDSTLSTSAGRSKDLMSIFFEPLDIESKVEGTATIKGPASNVLVDADFSLVDISVWGEPFDTGRLLLHQDKNQLTIEELHFQRRDGLGSALLRGTRKDEENNFEIVMGGVPLEYFSLVFSNNWPVRGKADLFAKIQGESFIPAGTIVLRDVWYGTEALGAGQITFHENQDRMVYQGDFANLLLLHGTSGLSLEDDFVFHFDISRFPLHIVAPRSFEGEPVLSYLSAVGTIEQKETELSLLTNIMDLGMTWKDRRLISEHPWNLVWSPQYIEVEPLRIIGTGETDVVLGGRWANGEADFEGNGQIDLQILEMFTAGIKRADGIAVVDAQYNQQGIQSELSIEEGFLDTDWFPHSLESLKTTISITDEGYDIEELTARLGGGYTDVTGFVRAESLVPNYVNLSIDLQEGRIRLLDFLPPIYGDATLKMTGDIDYPMLRGDVVVKEMNFTERIDWEDTMLTFAPAALAGTSVSDDPGYFSFDVNLTADNSIRIRNNLADVYGSAELKFIGDLAKPGMLGTIRLSEGGRALFKERDFEILRGEMRYEDPYTYDPRLDILMKTRISRQESDVEIDYHITGLYSNWQTYTSSNPVLSQADINALLVFGMTSEELELQGGLGTALLVEGGDLVVSKFGVVQRFNEVGEGIFQSEILHLDRIDLISGPTDRNSAYVSSALRLLAEKDIGENKIRLEQNLQEASDVFVSLERRVAERLYFRMYWTTEQQGGYLTNYNYGSLGTEFEVKWELD